MIILVRIRIRGKRKTMRTTPPFCFLQGQGACREIGGSRSSCTEALLLQFINVYHDIY
jgi:hypothetical protein